MANGDSLESLPQLGPRSRTWLREAGITSEARLRQLGAVAAYWRVKQLQPRASLNLLWALEGALCSQDWRDVARERRTGLLMALDDLRSGAGVPPGLPPD